MSALAYFLVFLKSKITFKIKCNCKESGKRMLGNEWVCSSIIIGICQSISTME